MKSVKPSTIYLNWFKANLHYNPITGKLTCKTKINQKRSIGDVVTQSDGEGYFKLKVRLSGKEKHFRAHNVAWYLHYNEWPIGIIDHKDGNGENNKLNNMRPASDNQNNMNRKITHNSTGHRGIRAKKHINKHGKEVIYYNPRIFFEGKRVSLGSFKNFDEAVKARIEAESKYFGEFAFSNREKKLSRARSFAAFSLITMLMHKSVVIRPPTGTLLLHP